jgi:hypothetical protein
MIPSISGQEYTDKCATVGLETLEQRRISQDMVQTFKILNGIGNMKKEDFFELVGNREVARTRLAQGALNLRVQRARTEIRKNAFAVRIVNRWNSLPDNVKTCENVNRFKNGLKSFIESGGWQGLS